ncbi:MAG: type toxin-antitoxin system HipA family toxin [Bradyrhizobium sp.]|nr:type toxin-antitoxin system HipA family toxin [Bradyrhizobium sp.]
MNLLPEGEPMRAMMRALGAAREDVIGLITQTGRDLAGALTIGAPRPGEKPNFASIASEDQLERIARLRRRGSSMKDASD